MTLEKTPLRSKTRIGILGLGAVGKCTLQFIISYVSAEKRELYSFDKATNRVKHHATNKTPLTAETPLDVLFVCIDTKQYTPLKVAQDIMAAMQSHVSPFYTKDTYLFIRTTVPVGTADSLRDIFGMKNVFSMPEYATEIEIKKGVYAIKHIGVPVNADVNNLPHGLEFLSQIVFRVGNKMVEFWKLAHNMRRAADILVMNDIVQTASRQGLDTNLVETLAVTTRPAPKYSGWMFGGKCLAKDLKLWSDITASSLSDELYYSNTDKAARVTTLALAARHKWMKNTKLHCAVVGLENAPGSGDSFNSPAEIFIRSQLQAYEQIIPVGPIGLVTKLCEIRNLTNQRQGAKRSFSTNLNKVNCIVIAQRSSDKKTVPFSSLMKVLKESSAPIKIVLNPCNAVFPDEFRIKAIEWGALFIEEYDLYP